jgi:AcrR family transcriptional regulator
VSPQAADPPERRPLEAAGLPKDIFARTDRGRLIDAMAEVCAERGYTEATIDEILDRAGVSAEVFAQNFEGKEDCAVALTNMILSEGTAAGSAAWSSDFSEPESTIVGFKALLEMFAARPSLAATGYIQARYAMPPSAFRAYASGVTIMASMIDRLRAYATDETLAPRTAASAVLGSSGMVVRRAIIAGETKDLPKLLPDIAYGFLVPFLGQEEALRIAEQARELLNEGG